MKTRKVWSGYMGKMVSVKSLEKMSFTGKPQHTPTPWDYKNFRIFATPETGIEVIALLATNKESRTPKQEANGLYIVTAVNSHESLKAFLKAFIDYENVQEASPVNLVMDAQKLLDTLNG